MLREHLVKILHVFVRDRRKLGMGGIDVLVINEEFFVLFVKRQLRHVMDRV